MIFDEELEVAPVGEAALDGHYVAVFVDDDGDTAALCACDTPFVAFAGAALSLVPFDVIDEMIARDGITATILDNFHEVMNICATLFMTNFGAEHLKLDGILRPASAREAVAGFRDGHEVSGFRVRIPRYGEGRLCCIVS